MIHNRRIFIATKHNKEAVIEALFKSEFNSDCFTSANFDTDVLGTFSGEITRKESALNTLRAKCDLGQNESNCDLVIASEGSFGPHPTIGIGLANQELVMLKDYKNNLEIVAHEISFDTNFNGQLVSNLSDLLDFAKATKFPSHGLILRKNETDCSSIHKGITNYDELEKTFFKLIKEFPAVYVETDMRANFNPMRMKVIEKATENLIKKIKNFCPNCSIPGFDIVKINQGLLCENCHLPTRSTLSYTYQCAKCKYIEEKKYPREIKFEDPTFCDNCNP